MKTLTEDTKQYIQGCWGLNYAEGCDNIVMLWSSGFYEEAAYLLMEAGAFSFAKGDTPKNVAKEVKAIYKPKNRKEVETAVDQCLSKDGDYRVYYCKHCEHVHYVNSLYYDDTPTWSCDGCDKEGLINEIE